MSSTEGSGGPPIVMSKAPVEKPEIVRGYAIVTDGAVQAGEQAVGSRVTFIDRRPGYVVTYHDVEVLKVAAGCSHVTVASNTIVTWDRLPAACL